MLGQKIIDELREKYNIDVGGNSTTPFEYQKHSYTPWEKTSDVIKAEENKGKADTAYNTFVNNGFNFSKQQDYTDAYNAWMGREDFSYDFNKDALYQQYKDKYIKQGKMAMADTMGQASAMTGGYGNSYAATAGNQAYQASLENLNDIIPELYQMAYDRYNQKGQDMLNTLSMLGNERSYERGIYESDLNRLANDRSYYATEADNTFARDYGIWDSNRTYDQAEHQAAEGYRYQNIRDAVADGQWQATMDENQRQFNESMASSKQQYDDSKTVAANKVDYSNIEDKAATFDNNGALADYIDGLGLDPAEADRIYATYATPDQKAFVDRTWTVTASGGKNWFGGINGNTKMKDQYGNEYSMNQLKKELVNSGMSAKEAEKWIVDLQHSKGIGSW